MRKSRKGASLVELMVYIALLALVMSGVLGSLIFGIKWYKRANIMSDMQNNCMFSIINVTNELCISDLSFVTANPAITTVASKDNGAAVSGTVGILIPSPKGMDDKYEFQYNATSMDVRVKWKRWVCFYLEPQGDGTTNLVMKAAPQSPVTDGDPGSSPYTIEQFAATNDPSVTKRLIARRITGLRFYTDASRGSNMLNIVIEADGPSETTQVYQTRVETWIQLLN